MKEPTKNDLLAELRRLKAENARLTRLVATQRPELKQLRQIEVGLRDFLQNGAGALERVYAECRALLPSTSDDLPTMEEMSGIWSDGKERVDAKLRDDPESSVE